MTLERTPEPEVMDSADEAADYDSMDHAEVNRRFTDDYLNFARGTVTSRGDGRGRHILDLGTGTAQIPILLSSRLSVEHTIVACDLSWEMLRVAKKNIHAASCAETVVPMLFSAREMPVQNSSIHHVISNSIIHHLPNPMDVLLEVRRVVAPGAVVFFRDLLRPDSAEDVERLVAQWAKDANTHQQQMFRDSLHAALTLSEMRELLAAVGFNPHWVQQTSDRHWTVAGRFND